jgi:hypothetical protein
MYIQLLQLDACMVSFRKAERKLKEKLFQVFKLNRAREG